jgi:hypothetical protein
MKIFFRGIPKEQRLIQATCQHCKSVIEFTVSEGIVTHDQRDGDYVTIDCPVCNCKIHKDLRQS